MRMVKIPDINVEFIPTIDDSLYETIQKDDKQFLFLNTIQDIEDFSYELKYGLSNVIRKRIKNETFG